MILKHSAAWIEGFVDKSNKNATTPISSLCCIPPYGELTKCSLIWKRFGQRLPNRADPHEEEQTRDVVGWHPCSYISSPSSAAMYPYSSQSLASLLGHCSDARLWMVLRCCRLCGLRLVFIVWGGARRALRFPLLISSGTATQVLATAASSVINSFDWP